MGPHHTFCHISILASFVTRPAVWILSHCLVPHWRALCIFPLATTWSIGTEVLCCAFQILCCPFPTSPLVFASIDLVICTHCGVICNCRSGMALPSTTMQTMDFFLVVPAKAQQAFPAIWSTGNCSLPSCLHSNYLHLLHRALQMCNTIASRQTVDCCQSIDPN